MLSSGKGLKKKFNAENFHEKLFPVLFKALYVQLELPSDQENKSGLAAERLLFLGH